MSPIQSGLEPDASIRVRFQSPGVLIRSAHFEIYTSQNTM